MAGHDREGAAGRHLPRGRSPQAGLGISRRLQDRCLLHMCADAVLWLAGDTAEPEHLTRLIGMNEALRQVTGFARSAWEHTPFASAIATLSSRLDEASIREARTEGYALSLQQMTELALEVLDEAAQADSPRAEARDASRRGVLSPREAEVLRMVAEGLSDKEISGRLFIAERTVRYHLTSIFGKLGAHNRTQAVRLADRQGLL